jgi:hypothetical protein
VDGGGAASDLSVPSFIVLMTSQAHPIRYTWSEYLAFEASSNVRHEFLDGQIYGMAGGTPEHAALAAAVIGLLLAKLRGGRSRAYDADLRVRVLATGLATYRSRSTSSYRTARDRLTSGRARAPAVGHTAPGKTANARASTRSMPSST